MKRIQSSSPSAVCRLLNRSFLPALVASMAMLASSPVHAVTWSGSAGSTDWSAGADWVGGVAPTSGAALTFTGTNASSTNTLTNTLTSSAFNVAGITFNAGAPAYTMTGNTFNLTAGIANNSSNLQTFSNTGGLTGSGSSLTFAVSSVGGINLATGYTSAQAGAQSLVVNGAGGTLTIGGTMGLNGSGTGAAVTDTISGAGNVNILANISNGNANANNLSYTGSGTLTLAGTNTYTGTTTLNSGAGTAAAYAGTGTLLIKSAGALGGNGSVVLTYGTFDNASGSALTMSGTNTINISSNSFLAFGGSNNLSFGNSPVNFNGNTTLNLGGTGTLTMGAAINATAGGLTEFVNGAGGNLVLSSFTLSSTAVANAVFGGNGNITFTNGLLGGSFGTGSFTYNGLGTLTVGGSSTYTGGTTINHGTFIMTGAAPTAGAISVNGGTFVETSTGSFSTALTLAGGNANFAGGAAVLSGQNALTGAITVNPYSTLTLDFSNASVGSNILTSTGSLNLSGGTLVIKGASGQTNSQGFSKLTPGAYANNSIVFNQNGATSLSASFGTIVRNAGTGLTLDVVLPTAGVVAFTGTTATNSIFTLSANGAAFATANGGKTWLTNVGGTLGALVTYATGTTNYTAANNVDVTNGDNPNGSFTVNTLRFNGSNVGLTTTGTTATKNVVTTGGILVTPGSNATITGGGTLTSGTTANELVFNDYGTLNVGVTIGNNVSALNVSIGGPGVTTFSAANTYAGSTTINSGSTLAVTNANGLSTGAINMNAFATLQLRNDNNTTYNNTLTDQGGTIIFDVNNNTAGTTGKTLTLNNLIVGTQAQINATGTNSYVLGINNINWNSTTGGGFALNGSTAAIAVGTISGSSTTSTVNLKLDGISTGNTVGVISNGVTTGTVTVAKVNTGTWSMTGASTYTGATTVGGGTLNIQGSMASTTLGLNGTGLINFNEAAGVSQSMGALSFTSGDGTVQSTWAGSSTGSVTFASLAARSAGATENFVVSGGTNGTSNAIVVTGIASGFRSQGSFFGGSSYAWANSAGGYVRGIAYGSDAGSSTSSGSTTLTGSYVQTTGAVTAQNTATFSNLNLAGTGTITGSNDFTLASTGSLSLQGILRSGNVVGSSATISGGAGLVFAANGDMVVRTDGINDVLTINTPITGANSTDNLVKSGAGTLNLGSAAVNLFYGNVYINQGTLNIVQESNLGGYTGTNPTVILNGGTLQAGASFALGANRNITLSAVSGLQTIDTQANTVTVNGVVSGGLSVVNNGISTGILAKTGSGTLIFNGTETYISQTVISAGTLQLGNGGTSGSVIGTSAIIDNGTLAFNRSNTVTQGTDFLPVISGSGGVNQIGTGAVIFNQANTYTGTTNINSGSLYVNASLASSTVNVGNGTAVATLAGNGTIKGALVTTSTGTNVAHIAPGATAGTVGTLNVGNLGFTIGDGTNLDYNLATAQTAGGGINDLILMTGGALNFGGTTTFNFTNSGSFTTTGSYTLISGAGSLVGFNASNFITTGLTGLTATYASTGTALTVSFSVSGGGSTPAVAYFNGVTSGDINTATNFYAAATGGTAVSGTIGATTDVFLTATSPTGSFVTTPTVNSAVTIKSLTLTGSGTPASSGVNLSGTGTVTLSGTGAGITVATGSGNSTLNVPLALGASQTVTVTDASNTLTISGPVSGTGATLTKAGAGTLVLSGSNTYTGGTTLSVGTLVAGTSTTVTGSVISSGPFGKGTLTLAGGTTLGVGSNAITLANAISMSGTITLSGTAGGSLTFDGTGLSTPSAVNLTGNTDLYVNVATTIADAITGSGNLTKYGTSTLTLTGSNSGTGGTTVTSGTLSVASGGSLGSGTVNLGSGSTFKYTGSGTLNQAITVTSGNATVANTGGSTLTLTGTLTKAGTNLILNAGGQTIDVRGAIVGNTGSFNSDLYVTNGTVIADNSNNTYSGPTHIYGNGTLVNGFNNALPTDTVVALGDASEGATANTNIYKLDGHTQSIAGLTSTNALDTNKVVGGNSTLSTLTLTGTATTLGAGILGGSGTNENNLAVKFSPGAGNTTTLTGSNTYNGGTEVVNGKLVVSNPNGSATGSGTFTLDSGATLAGAGAISSTDNVINGAVTPGNGGSDTTSVLKLSASGTTTFSGASLTFSLDSNSTNSTSLAMNGSVLFAGQTLTLNILNGSIVPDTTQYALFTNSTGGSGVGGSIFSGITVDGTNRITSGLNFTINSAQPVGYYANSYLKLVANGSGFNIDVEVVPEPGTWALMLGGLALLVVYQRARRSRNS